MLTRAHLSLKVSHPSFELDNLHIESGLLAPECRDLLLISCVFLFLMCEMSLDVLLDLEKLVCEGLANVLGLQGQLALEACFFDT